MKNPDFQIQAIALEIIFVEFSHNCNPVTCKKKPIWTVRKRILKLYLRLYTTRSENSILSKSKTQAGILEYTFKNGIGR